MILLLLLDGELKPSPSKSIDWLLGMVAVTGV